VLRVVRPSNLFAGMSRRSLCLTVSLAAFYLRASAHLALLTLALLFLLLRPPSFWPAPATTPFPPTPAGAIDVPRSGRRCDESRRPRPRHARGRPPHPSQAHHLAGQWPRRRPRRVGAGQAAAATGGRGAAAVGVMTHGWRCRGWWRLG